MEDRSSYLDRARMAATGGAHALVGSTFAVVLRTSMPVILLIFRRNDSEALANDWR